ncbi:MAG: D-aminoacyl-tRNA deacylase, partial [Chloroflexi bacterium]|nr:D-aminoacyl-tRNA deacylase [Chloroflexota bacterium]
MRAVVQRVAGAKVTVDGRVVGEIDRGLLVFLGIGEGDGKAEADYLAAKIASLRIFTDEAGKFNLSAIDTGGQVLVVSQFTLYGDVKRGRRPSFTGAAAPTQ